MWVWDQSKGELSQNGKLVSKGYSGRDRGKNNPAMQAAVGIGPIPRGLWAMTSVKDSSATGPFTIVLNPMEGTDTCERSAFRIHGDNIKNPGTASHGCIILPRITRQLIWDSGDHILQVIE